MWATLNYVKMLRRPMQSVPNLMVRCTRYNGPLAILLPARSVHNKQDTTDTNDGKKFPAMKTPIFSSNLKSSLLEGMEQPEKNQEEEDRKKKEKETKDQIKATKYSLIALGAMIGSMVAYGVSEWGPESIDANGQVIKDEFSDMWIVKGYSLRTWRNMTTWNEVIKDPSRELLLPDPLSGFYIQPKYTVILESNGILVHPDWTYRTGWRFKKRPYVDYLLQACSPPAFELVIFTQDQGYTAQPIIDSLDPQGYVMYRLYRDSTKYVDGIRMKDLNFLNRDLSKVIHVDWNKDACSNNPDNCLIIPKWDGSNGDNILFDLAQFIRAISTQDVDDVRQVLNYYRQFDDPLSVFKEKQAQLLKREQETQTQTTNKSLVGTFRRK